MNDHGREHTQRNGEKERGGERERETDGQTERQRQNLKRWTETE